MEKEAQIKRQLEALEKMDPEEAYDDFEETMKKVKKLKHDNGAFQDETSVHVRVLFEDIQRRKEAIKALVLATEKVDKKLLQEFLAQIVAVKERWGQDVCAEAEQAAKMALDRIEKEQFASDIMKLIEQNGASGNPGYVNIDNLGDVRLKHQLNKLQEFGAHAAEAIEALEKGRCILSLRQALRRQWRQTKKPMARSGQRCSTVSPIAPK